MREINDKNLLKIANDLIFGVGGLEDYKKYELAQWNGKKGLEKAYWVLRCIVKNEKYQKLLGLKRIK